MPDPRSLPMSVRMSAIVASSIPGSLSLGFKPENSTMMRPWPRISSTARVRSRSNTLFAPVSRVRFSAVIAVPLHTSSDLLLTITANTLTLIPGSSLVDVDRLNRTLYVHVLDADDDEAIERNRQHILTTEKRLIRAIGSRDENASLEQDRTVSGARQEGGMAP